MFQYAQVRIGFGLYAEYEVWASDEETRGYIRLLTTKSFAKAEKYAEKHAENVEITDAAYRQESWLRERA